MATFLVESIEKALTTPVTSTVMSTELVISKMVTSESQMMLTFSQFVSLIALIFLVILKVESEQLEI